MGQTSKKNHENIEIVSEKKLKLVRQDRLDVSTFDCSVEIDNQKYRVSNISTFGLAIDTKDSLPIEKNEVKIFFEDYEISKLHIRAVRQEPSDSGFIKFAYEIIGEPLPINAINAIISAKQLLGNIHSHLAPQTEISSEFKLKTFEVKRIIEIAKSKIDALEKNRTQSSVTENLEHDEVFCQVVADYFTEAITPFYSDLSKALKGKSNEEIKHSFDFFRSEIGNTIFEAPFADRVYNKPLGYAGDYEMMNIIYRKEVEGKTLYGRCLHKYFIEKPAAIAVRNRSVFMKEKIRECVSKTTKDKAVRILSMASGPAKEIQDFLFQELDEGRKIEFHLVDQDLQSLQHAQKKLYAIAKKRANIKLFFHNTAIKNIIARGLPEKDFDLIYSAGLFDYFSDPVAQMAGQKIFDSVKKDGSLIIGNFSMENPNQFEMDLALDWRLIYRSKEDMDRLFSHLPGHCELESEHLNINLFYKITKK